MDPGPSKSGSKPVPLGPTDTANTRGTVVEPFGDRPAFTDSYLQPAQAPDEIGRLGQYRVLAELGRGGMGAVYRAEDPTLERVVALKVLLPELAADPRARERFVREAKAQAKVEHDHIIAIHDVKEAEGVAFIVMPLLKGMSLATALRLQPRPPLPSLIRIGKEVAEGLSAAHAVGLIHRDIKPGNIWLEGDRRRVKILDFGVAQTVAPDGGRHTASGAVVGSPAYMSPEQAHGRPIDPRADLFALGVVLYEMATGRRPFTGPSVMDVLSAVSTYDPPPAAEFNPDVPPVLSDLIARLMAKAPAARPASAADVARELDSLGRTLAAPVPVLTLPAVGESNPWAELDSAEPEDESDEDATVATRVAAPRTPARKWVWPAVAVGVVAALLVGGLLIARPWRGKPTDGTAALSDPRPRSGEAGPGEPTPPIPVPKADDRKAAEWALNIGKHGQTEIKVRQNGEEVSYYPGNELPPGPLELVSVTLNVNPELTDAGLANLTGCANLVYLSLCGNITDTGLKHLRGLTALENVNLSYTRITARGLTALKDSTKLKYAIVQGIALGDDVAVLGATFPALEYARVTMAGVTERGVEQFHEKRRDQKLPNCSLETAALDRPVLGLAFDGTTAFVEVPDLAFDGKLPLTVEAWVTPETVDRTVRHIILFGSPGGGIGIGGDGRAFGAGLKTESGWVNDYTRTALKAGQTVHVAAVLTEKQFALYIDGKQAGIKAVNLGKLPATIPPAVIGKHVPNTPVGYFHGTIHGVRVSRAALYEKDFIPSPPHAWLPGADTAALYHFDDLQGTVLTDYSAHKRHGTITGATRVGPKP